MWRMCTPCTNGLGEQHLCKVMYNNYRSIGVQLEQMTDSLVCMCACVRHGIHAHSIIESIPDGIRFCCGLHVYYTAGTAK